MKRLRGSFLTRYANGRFSSTMPTSVPVNSQGRFLTPPAIPIVSRIGRRMELDASHRENIEPAPADRAQLLGPHRDDALQQPDDRPGGAGRGQRIG